MYLCLMDPDAGGPIWILRIRIRICNTEGNHQSIKPALWQPGNVGGGPDLHPPAGQVSDQRWSSLPLTRLHVPIQVSAGFNFYFYVHFKGTVWPD
jgi:hypothetical protein